MKRGDTSPLHKRKPRPVPIRSRAALEYHLSEGGKICKTLPRIESEPVLWTDPATDRAISRRIIEKAFADGLLRGCGDGLFDDSHQTYERAA